MAFIALGSAHASPIAVLCVRVVDEGLEAERERERGRGREDVGGPRSRSGGEETESNAAKEVGVDVSLRVDGENALDEVGAAAGARSRELGLDYSGQQWVLHAKKKALETGGTSQVRTRYH